MLIGRVFRVFDQQDSGCVSYGVAIADERWFVKMATTAVAATALERTIALHAAVQHSTIVRPQAVLHDVSARPVLIYPLVDGAVLYHATKQPKQRRSEPDAAMARFRREPLDVIERVLDDLLDAHVAVARAGFVAVDFYDGCVIYGAAAQRVALCDLDEYRPGPFTVDGERLPESKRFMAPEELRRGEEVDERTTVFNLGRALRLFLDAGDDELAWRGTADQLAVVTRATRQPPAERYPTVAALAVAWRAGGHA